MLRILIIGCGDTVRRALPWLTARARVYALARSEDAASGLRQAGVTPIIGDLDSAASLQRLAGIADWVIHSAPPAHSGSADPRSRRLLAALARRGMVPQRLVYISTTGVYGDCGGEWIDETRRRQPASARGQRRLAAEQLLRSFARRRACRVSLLRAPGIYAADRLPLARLQAATPAIIAAEDSYSNHIHADDLAHAVCLALFRGQTGRAYNVCDQSALKMGDWFDRVADHFALPRPPRLPRAVVQQQVTPLQYSFLAESRRIDNTRLRRELRLRLRYPDVDAYWRQADAVCNSRPDHE